MKTAMRCLIVLACGAVTAVPARSAGQNAQDILNTAIEKYEKRMEGVENYTVVQDILGSTMSTYYERQVVNGRTVFLSPNSSRSGGEVVDPYADMSKIMEKAKYVGRKDIDGTAAHEIRIDDPQDTQYGKSLVQSQGNGDFTIETMTMFVDAKDYVIRRMEMKGSMQRDGKTSPISTTVDFLDYRTVDHVMHPFRMVMSMEGIAEAADISEKDLAKAKESLAKLEADMAKMPESQRKMMERFVGGQIEKLRAIVETGGTEFTIDVKELKVNAGPPSH
jgi:hypothetical protein